VYIKVPVSLENYFVEGSYGKILQQQQQVPLEEYTFFVSKFADAIRIEIARSAERSYESLALNDMQKMFTIETREELNAFIATNDNKDGISW
jgi:hypothetical protein